MHDSVLQAPCVCVRQSDMFKKHANAVAARHWRDFCKNAGFATNDLLSRPLSRIGRLESPLELSRILTWDLVVDVVVSAGTGAGSVAGREGRGFRGEGPGSAQSSRRGHGAPGCGPLSRSRVPQGRRLSVWVLRFPVPAVDAAGAQWRHSGVSPVAFRPHCKRRWRRSLVVVVVIVQTATHAARQEPRVVLFIHNHAKKAAEDRGVTLFQ